MRNAYMQAHHNLVCRVCILHPDLHLDVYVHTIAHTSHKTRRDRIHMLVHRYSRDCVVIIT